ncbi:ABC transporter ATP-binding protein [Polynucleobacter sp. AP-RePozz3-80-G7]|uniref:ABC transporter ATP-binding protein n=1 Tax=Polynucleobacter sp. AP-RePozz3-80-G7 TaxID=2689105 RepID=UPI001C0DD4E7|nr:ABC transporter ATP-binding protein [Polynucleobacter sp. AP-RePozz3-80-G7]
MKENISYLNNSVLRKLWGVLTRFERRRALAIFILMLVGMALETLSVGIIIPAFTLLAQKNISQNHPGLQIIFELAGSQPLEKIIFFGAIFLVIVYCIKTIFLALLAWEQTKFAFNVSAELSKRLFAVYLFQPYTFHLKNNSSQLIRNVITEVGMFTGNGIQPGMTLLAELMVVVGLSGLLLFVEPLGAVAVVSIFLLASWVFYSVSRKYIGQWGEARQFHDGKRLQHLQQGLGGIKDVKLFGREMEFLQQYNSHNFQSAQAGQNQSTLQQLPRLWLELLAVLGLAILIISMTLQQRSFAEIMLTMGLFAAAAFRIMPSVNRILGALQSLRYGLPVINILYRELNLKEDIFTGDIARKISFEKTLEIKHLSYHYPGVDANSLEDICLVIQRGETIGFIGSSGAGKSTLVDILLGLLYPKSGDIKVDGVNIQHAIKSWQKHIGYVPQHIYLIDDTLRRNIAFGLPSNEIDDLAIDRAIQAAQLGSFVAELPDGLETEVGERGIRLSGGQRQRIGIARALYCDPPVLMLDEATSSLDYETESDVMQAISSLHGIKTILIIAHRLSTIKNCDRVYKLGYGKLEEVKMESLGL